jgi:hypothetical protein
MIATIVAGFDIKKAVGADGKPEELVVEYTTGFLRCDLIFYYELCMLTWCVIQAAPNLSSTGSLRDRSEMHSLILFTVSRYWEDDERVMPF